MILLPVQIKCTSVQLRDGPTNLLVRFHSWCLPFDRQREARCINATISALWMRKHWFVALVLCERLAESSSLSNPNLPIVSTVNDPLAKDRIQSTATTGLYVHIPFCRRRCRYCDFAIVPIGNTLPTSLQEDNDSLSQCQQHKKENILFDSYQTAIIKEIQSLERTSSQGNSISKRKVLLDTIYFGGGTPSLAPLSMLQAIVNAIQATFDLADSLEFTMECDPGKFA